MRRPRLHFSLRALLIVPLVVGFAIIWYSWPDRKFAALQSALVGEDFEVANSIVSDSSNSGANGMSGCTFEARATGVQLKSHSGEIHTTAEDFVASTFPPTYRSMTT